MPVAPQEPEWRRQRQLMVSTQLLARGIRDERVLAAMGRVPRERFVPAAVAAHAYEDTPLPIAGGQTISQPYIVACMSEALALTGCERVLEVGTGSGYQTAILSLLAVEVHSVERNGALSATAGGRLREGGYANVTCYHGDGWEGIPAAAPFGGILVAAAARARPLDLFHQLAEGGRMILPLEEDGGVQRLLAIRRQGDRWDECFLTGVRFVPLLRGIV